MLSQATATRDRCVRFKYLLGCHNLNFVYRQLGAKTVKVNFTESIKIRRIYFSVYFRSCYTIIEYINVQYLVWRSRIVFWSKKASSRENIMASSNLPLGVNKRVSPHTRKASILFYFCLPNSLDCLELILHRHSLCWMNKWVFFLMVTMIMGTR